MSVTVTVRPSTSRVKGLETLVATTRFSPVGWRARKTWTFFESKRAESHLHSMAPATPRPPGMTKSISC